MTDDASQTPKSSAGPDTGEPTAPAAGSDTAVHPTVPVVPPAPTPAEPPVPVAPPEPGAAAPAPVIAAPAPPATTASGLDNPYGLPDIAVDRPEVAVGAAFGGGLVLALILKRLAR